MLVDPIFPTTTDEDLKHILTLMTHGDYDALKPTRHSQGVYLVGHHNFNHTLGESYNDYPAFGTADENGEVSIKPEQRPEFFVRHDGSKVLWTEHGASLIAAGEEVGYLGPYGVCDSLDQLLSAYRFDEDPLLYCISLCEVRREHEPDSGGWRWHKWGEYIGTQKPTSEYMAHEPVIESVWCYHIYQLGAKRCNECFGQRRSYDESRPQGERFGMCAKCSGKGYMEMPRAASDNS